MALSAEEARVLACLIEEGSTPDAETLTLDAVRLASNKTVGRAPVVTYDDRTVDRALLSLKSMGLVRFVPSSDGGRITRYRQTADERWRLTATELAVLAALALRGPQTSDEVRRGTPPLQAEHGPSIDAALDTLASRRPEPFAGRLEPASGKADVRYTHLLGGGSEAATAPDRGDSIVDAAGDRSTGPSVATLVAEIAFLRARVDRLEHELGLADDDPAPGRRKV